jgi:hypothetical protein
MKFIVLYLFLFILSSCVSNKNKVLFGEYESKKYNAFQDFYMFKISKETYIMGTKLFLNKDSTYTQKNCGSTSTGKWYLQNDTIFMQAFTNRYNNDSLHNANGSLKIGRNGPVYKIVGNHLVYLENFNFMGKKVVHRLVKVK